MSKPNFWSRSQVDELHRAYDKYGKNIHKCLTDSEFENIFAGRSAASIKNKWARIVKEQSELDDEYWTDKELRAMKRAVRHSNGNFEEMLEDTSFAKTFENRTITALKKKWNSISKTEEITTAFDTDSDESSVQTAKPIRPAPNIYCSMKHDLPAQERQAFLKDAGEMVSQTYRNTRLTPERKQRLEALHKKIEEFEEGKWERECLHFPEAVCHFMQLFNERGLILYQLQVFDKAFDDFTRVLYVYKEYCGELLPVPEEMLVERRNAFLHRAIILANSHNFIEALVNLKRALRSHDKDLETRLMIFYVRALCYYGQNSYEKCLETCRMIMALDSEFKQVNLLFTAVSSLRSQGDKPRNYIGKPVSKLATTPK